MHPQVDTIANRLSLRQPQREALEILARVGEIIPLQKNVDVAQTLSIIQSEFPRVADFLARLDDLVLLMDESHRYRAKRGLSAINELKPILGLELTATPQIEAGKTSTPFKNVIYSYRSAVTLRSPPPPSFLGPPATTTTRVTDSPFVNSATGALTRGCCASRPAIRS